MRRNKPFCSCNMAKKGADLGSKAANMRSPGKRVTGKAGRGVCPVTADAGPGCCDAHASVYRIEPGFQAIS